MADYLIDEGTDEIPIPGASGATVTMKRQATYEDEMAVLAAMPAGVEKDVFWKLFVPARTIVMIESWTLKNGDGSVLPCNEEVLTKRLPRKMAKFIVDEAERRYNAEDEDDGGPLGSPSPTPSPETRSTTPEP